MKISAILLSILFSMTAFAEDVPVETTPVEAPVITDLLLPGEKWVAAHDNYLCEAFGEPVAAPSFLENLQVKFEMITSDASLDNALMRATFVENGNTCRYNAVLFADNALQKSTLLQSIAYNTNNSPTAYMDCVAGKKVLDAAFAETKYLYYGHPHNLAFMIPGEGVGAVCGDKELIGVNFVVKGKLK